MILPVTLSAFLGQLAFAASLALVSALIVRIVLARPILDQPNARSAHSRPTPKGGGLGIVVALVLGLAVLYARATTARLADPYFLAVMAGALAIAAVSLADDLLDFSFRWKLATQLGAALAPMPFGLVLDTLSLPFLGELPLGPLGYPLTLAWILFATNAMNFIDGLDGLCAGVAAIATGFLAILALSEGGSFVYAACLVLCAGCLGFLPFNLPAPLNRGGARIFLGDVGSQTIGYMLAVLAVAASRFEQTRVSVFVLPLILALPLFDVAFTLIRRAIAGERLTQPHRGHLYQVLHRSGMSALGVAAIHWLATVLMGVVAFRFLRLGPHLKLMLYLGVLASCLAYAAWVAARARRAGIQRW